MEWYCLDIIYDGETPGSVDRYMIKNLTGAQVMNTRYDLFTSGLYVPDKESPGTEGEVIIPHRIRKIFVTMQEKKFE